MVDEEAFIDSVECVASVIEEESGEVIKHHVIYKLMKEMDIKYKKVKHIPLAGNKCRALVLRQQWAKRFLSLPLGTTIISIDETWVNMSDFRRSKW